MAMTKDEEIAAQLKATITEMPKRDEPDEVEQDHPHREDAVISARVYNVSQKIDKILNREDITDHAAILGIIQVTSQRRMHEHEVRKQKLQQQQQREQMEAQQEARRRAQFAPN